VICISIERRRRRRGEGRNVIYKTCREDSGPVHTYNISI
jgi:hypothetical protein